MGGALLAASTASAQPAIDFTSNAGFEQTCRHYVAVPPRKLAQDREKIAFAICNGVELLRAGARGMRDEEMSRGESQGAVDRIRALLEDALLRIRTARELLETVKGPGPYLRIEPGTWLVDLDGDGVLSPMERYFFWVPKRGASFQGGGDEASYRAHFTAPVIKVDRSDVYWAIAYCHFAEAALNLVLSYRVVIGPRRLEAELRDPKRVSGTAYRNLTQGLVYSGRLRDSLLKETDDDAEWIPNPRQVNTSFPLVMDEQTFATWGELLGHLDLLVAGKTLLGGAAGAAGARFGVRDLSMGLCAPGEGFNIRRLFLEPVRQPLNEAEWRARCVKADAAVPFSGLAKLIEESAARNAGRGPENMSGEWMILRHLYWVN